MPAPEIIHAAGGIVWKKENDELKIAVVYRDRHGPEWSLPKGKLQRKKHESWEEAAIRETTEELGLQTAIISYADTISYHDNESPKVVVFWHMRIADETPLKRDNEVKEVQWLTPAQAAEKVTYGDLKKLLKNIKYPDFSEEKAIKKRKILSNIFFEIHKLIVGRAKFRRLAGDLEYYKEELNYALTHKNPDKCWTSHAQMLYQQACQNLEQIKIDEAWKSFHASKRMLIFGMEQAELNMEAIILRQEAVKLNEWRRKAVYQLIGSAENPKADVTDVEMFKATALKDEHYHNEYYKNRITLTTFTLLILSLIILLSIIIAFFYNVLNPSMISEKQMMYSVILFGLLGGITSSMFKIRSSSKVTRIPEVINSNYFTFMRIFIGAVSALIIYLALKAGIGINFIDLSRISMSQYFYFVIAFIAGFTERLLLRAVTTIVGKE